MPEWPTLGLRLHGRVYKDETGLAWHVWEVTSEYLEAHNVDLQALDEELRDGWLCFQCERERLRFWMVPPGWTELTDRQLEILRRRAILTRPSQEASPNQ